MFLKETKLRIILKELQAKSVVRNFTIRMDHGNYLYKMPSTIPGRSRENRSHTFHKPAKLYQNFSVIHKMNNIDTTKKYHKTLKQQMLIDFVKFPFQYIDWLNLNICHLDGRKKDDNTMWTRSRMNSFKKSAQLGPRKVTVTQCMGALYLPLNT